MSTRSNGAMLLFLAGALLMASQPLAADPPKSRYVFVENTDRWVGIARGDWYLVGKLDKNGDFIHEIKLKKGQGSTLLPAHGVINSSGHATRSKKAYEFRSGMLIPGEIRPDGYFVPEAGGKIIPFKDYEYGPTALPIWNLPGLFVTEEEAAEWKKAKAGEKR